PGGRWYGSLTSIKTKPSPQPRHTRCERRAVQIALGPPVLLANTDDLRAVPADLGRVAYSDLVIRLLPRKSTKNHLRCRLCTAAPGGGRSEMPSSFKPPRRRRARRPQFPAMPADEV